MGELSDLPIKTVDGAVIHLGDVAQVRDGYQPQQNVVRNEGLRGALLRFTNRAPRRLSMWSTGSRRPLPQILSGLSPT